VHTDAQNTDTQRTLLSSDPNGIRNAVELITKDTRHREMRCLERRSDTRLPFQRPVEVVALGDHGEPIASTIGPIIAYTRDISASGVGLLHDQPIPSKRVLVNFEMLGGETIGLVVALTWSRYVGDFWHSSGGRLVGVVSQPNPVDPNADWSQVPERLGKHISF
jgi:hypothetical protein